jgi:drug/metabolite transporter (DMT)-like permease
MNPNIGEIAALGTAMCFSASSIFFTQAGKKYGPLVSNRLRLVVAVIVLVILNWVLYGSPFPIDAGIERWLWLGSSGIIGLAIGDLFLFQAYVTIGARLGLLF